MRFLHVDQRAARARCEEILARVPAEDADHEAAHDELAGTLRGVRLVPGTTPKGVASVLLIARDTGTPEVSRVIDRAIPLRGRLRPVSVAAALAAMGAITAGLAWIAPWALAVIALLAAWLGVRAMRRFVARHTGAVEVARMEQAARVAGQTGNVGAANALYAEARRMIAEDRVPAGVGFRIANILGTAAIATPFPVDVLRELRELWLIAPEAELAYAQVRDELERRLQRRVESLAATIRRALRTGEDIAPLRAELRELARTAPGVLGARVHQAEILRQLTRAAMEADPPVPLGGILDEIEELITWLAALDGGVSIHDRSLRELADLLDDIVAHSTAPEALARADALRARIDVIPIRRASRRPARPAPAPVDGAPGRRRRPLTELRAAVTASADPERIQLEVIALYRQVRDAAAGGHEHDVRALVSAMRLVATWATVRGDARLLGELHGDARQLLDRRNIPAGSGAELAGVLRACVGADSFPVTLLDDYAALRALASDVRATLFWSIVDAAILRIEARLRELAKPGAATRDTLGEIAAAFEATAARSSDPEITLRARKLAARR